VPTTLDCTLLRDVFGSAELREAFDSRALLQSWLDAERGLAEAEAEVGIVPRAAAERIARECDASLYDLDALREGIAESQHPLVPLIRALAERCGEDGGWVHWGATTQDILDTGLALQIRSALVPIGRDLERSTAAAVRLAGEHRDTPMAGRTHGQHAVPITFGLKAATWADELARGEERLRRAREAALTAQLAGAAGTLAALGEQGPEVRRAFARVLGLAEAELPWYAARDRLRDLGHALEEIAAAGERIAAEIVRLQSTEIAEASEPLAKGHVGSSTMPQKRNPFTCHYLIASARLLRATVSALTASPAHAHERDMGLWAVEWLALPEAMILAGGLLDKLAHVLEGLQVDPERMRANLGLTRGQIMAESVMMALGRGVGHEHAHELVTAATRRATAEGRELGDVLAGDEEVAAYLSAGELSRLLDPASYLGLSGAAVDAVIGENPAS
jgi:adenylosuccinate lyase/3-carboxy-cis,cis-muconate cycloisomerase